MAEGGDSAVAGIAGRAGTPRGVAESLGVTAIAGAAKTRGVAEADAEMTGAGSAGVAGMTGRVVVETLGIAGRAGTPLGVGVAVTAGVVDITGIAKVAEGVIGITGVIEEL